MKTVGELRHVYLSTQITSVLIQDSYIFVGEGCYLGIFNSHSYLEEFRTRVFRTAVVHGIKVAKYEDTVILLLWGQKSIMVMVFNPYLNTWKVVVPEETFEDWIVDALMTNSLEVVLATAHNTLLHCHFPLLGQLFIQKSEEVSDMKSADGSLCIKMELGHEEPRILSYWEHLVNRKSPYVIDKCESNEKCILYCGCIVGTEWDNVVLLAGTVFSEVLVWGTLGDKDNFGRVVPLHRLTGHKGVLFSVNYSSSRNLITTTSDDRSLRVWEVKTEFPKHMGKQEREDYKNYWKYSLIGEKCSCYGHGARVWQSIILKDQFVSVSEDSSVCLWEENGQLLHSWRAHEGASVWCASACSSQSILVTGGGDGAVRIWNLNCTKQGKPLPVPLEMKDTKLASDNLTKQSGSIDHGENFRSRMESLDDVYKKNDSLCLNESGCIKKDFPRTIGIFGHDQVLVVTNKGKVCCVGIDHLSWSVIYEDARLCNYVLMQTSPDGGCKVALATLSGYVIIIAPGKCEQKWQVELDAQLECGKVYSLLWLDAQHILTCGGEGVIAVWSINFQKGVASKEKSHTLPPSKQRWVAAASLWNHQGDLSYLLVGDRVGSLYLYSQDNTLPVSCLKGVHGRNGVTCVEKCNGEMVSTGRDGCLCFLDVIDGKLSIKQVVQVNGLSWIAGLCWIGGVPHFVTFHDVKLLVWRQEEERALVEIECGGGHRSWDFRASFDQDTLKFVFLKDCMPYVYSTSLKDKLFPSLKNPLHSKEVNCLEPLGHIGRNTIFMTGSEDTTLRIHILSSCGHRKVLNVIHSHISSVKTICSIEGNQRGEKNNKGIWSEHWVVTAGGRAQLKIWKVRVIERRNVLHSPGSAVHSVPRPSDSSATGAFTLDTHKEPHASFESVTNSDCTSEEGIEDQVDIKCEPKEVVSHMLRAEGKKSWKSQEVTVDPETRYMDSVAWWVDSQKALVCLASSDGYVRLFVFDSSTEEVHLCTCLSFHEHCVLKVRYTQVAGWSLLFSAATDGKIAFWDISDIIEDVKSNQALERKDSDPQLPVHSVTLHQSGINSIAVYCNNSLKTTSITLATGGDDNSLSVCKVEMNMSGQTLGLECHQLWRHGTPHACQVTGLQWLGDDSHLVSTSIDQRLIVWQLDKVDGVEEVCGTVAGSAFCSTADIQGLQEVHHKGKHCLFIYGVGLEVYEVGIEELL